MKAEILITDSLVVMKAALFGAAFLPEINAAYLNTASLTEKIFHTFWNIDKLGYKCYNCKKIYEVRMWLIY